MNSIIEQVQNFISMGTFSAFRHPGAYLEIAIIAFVIYHILVWIKNTRAWTLFKGIVVVLVFALLAELLHLTTILWIFGKTFNVVAIAVIVIFQPELRKALEELGRKRFVASLFSTGEPEPKGQINSDKCINEVVRAAYEMAKVKTGALIVLEREVLLSEYERTGIPLDSVVSSQLLINIFEHNTPLHDGAVFIRSNRIVAATCYLPLSDNMELSKELGTRHRAAVGISEVSDSMTIVVSEETGAVSLAQNGKLQRELDMETLKRLLTRKTKAAGAASGRFSKLKEIVKYEKKDNK